MIRIIITLLFLSLITPASAQVGKLKAWNVYANPSSSENYGTTATLSSIIDGGLSCSAQNSMLYRGSTAWNGCITPSNNSILNTNSSGVPSWLAETNNSLLSVNGSGVLGFTTTIPSSFLATVAQYLAGTATGVAIQPSIIYPTETTTTFGTTTSFDFSTFINTAVTLTGNITTMNVSNVKAGQSGMITFIQDGTGSRTTVWNSVFKFAGGLAPTLSTAAGDIDVLAYSCRSSTFCVASLTNNVH
jgi:hypothetical protein